jgi:hypothetical protein
MVWRFIEQAGAENSFDFITSLVSECLRKIFLTTSPAERAEYVSETARLHSIAVQLAGKRTALPGGGAGRTVAEPFAAATPPTPG